MAWKSWEYNSGISHSAVLGEGKISVFTNSCFSLSLNASHFPFMFQNAAT